MIELIYSAVSDLAKNFLNRVRYGKRVALQLFLYEHQPYEMRDPDDPLLIRRFTDKGLHTWLGKATAPASRSLLEREVRRREALPAYRVSLAALIVSGAALIGTVAPFLKRDATNDKRCLAIQRDMLSARPRRSDSPDLFQALGCRPQGEGSVYALPRR